MNSCTFIGHRNCPEVIKDKLYNVIEKLILEKNVTIFYGKTIAITIKKWYNSFIKVRKHKKTQEDVSQ